MFFKEYEFVPKTSLLTTLLYGKSPGEKRPELALEQIPPLNSADSAASAGPAGAQSAQMDSGPPHLLDPGHLDDPAHVG